MLTENTLWQLLDQGVGRALIFLFYACLPLLIGVDDYGTFAFLQALMLIAVQPAMALGLDVVVVKRVARGERGGLRPALRLRASLVGATGVLAVAACAFAGNEVRTVVLLLWVYLAVLSFENLLFAYYRGIESMRMEGVVGVLQKALALPFLGLLAALGVGGAALPAASLALMAAAGVVILGRLYKRPLLDFLAAVRAPGADASALLHEGAVVGLAAFVSAVYFRIDSVMLGLLADREAVSMYNVAYRFMETAFIVPFACTNVIFPRLASAARPATTLRAATLILAALGLTASAIVYAAGPPLIAWLYGAEYARAGRALAVLALAIAPVYVGGLLTQALIAFERPRTFLRVTVLGVGLNVLLNLFLIPAYGETGAATATFATELGVAVLAAAWLRGPPRENTSAGAPSDSC